MEAVGDDSSEAWITQGAGAVRGVEVFVELVGELAVVAGFGDVVPRWRIRGEEGLAGAKPVIEEFTRQRIGEAEGDEAGGLSILHPAPGVLHAPHFTVSAFNFSFAVIHAQVSDASTETSPNDPFSKNFISSSLPVE